MYATRVVAVLVFVVLQCGCAGSISSFYNRPVVEDSIGSVGVLSQSADRRAVLVVHQGESLQGFCAEPPPDAALSISSTFNAAAKNPKIDASVADAFKSVVTALSARTPAVEMFRTGTYALCQYQLAGMMTPERADANFRQLVEVFREIELERARNLGQPTADPGKPPAPDKEADKEVGKDVDRAAGIAAPVVPPPKSS